MARPQILVAGVLDTKGKEIGFLAERVRQAGGDPTIMELSVGSEVDWADIGVGTVIERAGYKREDVFALERSKAAAIIVKGATSIAGELLAQNRLDGVIAFGGSMGTSMATEVMQSLPIGLPKVMLSTMTSGDVRPYVGTKDIAMMYPIAEVGLNKVTRQVLNRAAGAVVGMATAPVLEVAAEKPLVGCMMFGVTTPCVLRASQIMEDNGYDVLINHAVGSGGKSMEELIEDGFIVGVLDITTHEIADFLLGGVLSAGPDRLSAASRQGIPQVVAPGGLDLINFGGRETVPAKFEQEMDLPGRALYVHNPTVTCVGVSVDEAYQIGLYMADKLNKATGPTALCVPLRGWGACDTGVADKALGWPGPGSGPVWVADPENSQWSWRAKRFVEALRDKIDRTKPNLEVLLVDRHMNEPEFADLLAGILAEMLKGSWAKGSLQKLPEIVSAF